MRYPSIDARRLTVTQGGRRVLDEVSISVERGERVALLGRGSVGRSTLLRVLAGQQMADRGSGSRVHVVGREVQLDGVPFRRLRRVRRHVALVDNLSVPLPLASVLDNAALGMAVRWPAWQWLTATRGADRQQRAGEALALVGLHAWARRRAAALTSPQRLRLALARAMMQGADVLLVDRAALAELADAGEQIAALLAALSERTGATVVLATDRPADALAHCTRAVLLHAGRVVFDGPPVALGSARLPGWPAASPGDWQAGLAAPLAARLAA